ncbi:hypothetical protein NHJ6243_009113, partial [Beauveria neobassiana]
MAFYDAMLTSQNVTMTVSLGDTGNDNSRRLRFTDG